MRRRNGAEHYHTSLTTPQPREMMPLACENTVDAGLCHCLACAQAWACCPVPTFHSQTRELRWRDAMQQLTPVGACGNSVGGSSLSSFANPAGLPRINQDYGVCSKLSVREDAQTEPQSCSLPRSWASGHPQSATSLQGSDKLSATDRLPNGKPRDRKNMNCPSIARVGYGRWLTALV